MILCPICGVKTRVTETRVSDKSARRRRVCSALDCVGKVTTIEIVVPEGCGPFLGKGSVIISGLQLKRLRKLVGALDALKGIEL